MYFTNDCLIETVTTGERESTITALILTPEVPGISNFKGNLS
jgi:hypothetical protein